VALRFDLTVPFARYVAQYRQDLGLPFKRYHIAKVWRGENTQRGRYREFTQCDFDIVGSESAAADFEILLVMRHTFRALGLGVKIHLNHRGLFNAFLARIGAAEKSVEILRTVDKLAKIGEEETRKLLAGSAGEEGAARILEFVNCRGSYGEILEALTERSGGPSPGSARLKTLSAYIEDTGTGDSFVLDPAITRGLDYYTGIVYETFLDGDPAIGSVCSGGRYDNLAGLYSRDQISGVGSSIGLDRLAAALESQGKMPERRAYTLLAITAGGEEEAGRRQALAGEFRAAGIPCEVLLEGGEGRADTPAAAREPVPGSAPEDRAAGPQTSSPPGSQAGTRAPGGKALIRQFVQAEKKGIPWVLIPAGEGLTLRDIRARQNREGLSVRDVIGIVRGVLP
jgi:histidyl-tRNA synthetase